VRITRPDIQHCRYAGLPRPLDHGIAVRIELLAVNMTM
jgi:hypothetical protein